MEKYSGINRKIEKSLERLKEDLKEQDVKEGSWTYGKYQLTIRDITRLSYTNSERVKRHYKKNPSKLKAMYKKKVDKYKLAKEKERCISCGKKAQKKPKGGRYIRCKKCRLRDIRMQRARKEKKKI